MNSIGIIGLGTIGTAIAQGLHKARPELEILATRRSPGDSPAFVTFCRDNRELVKRASFVLLCVKPQQARNILKEIQPELRAGHVLVSTCAGVTMDAISEIIPNSPNVARAMPNVPCELNQGVTALAFSAHWQSESRDDVVQLFESLGKALVVEERHFDAVTAVSGCGPAYVCVIIEALTDAGVKQGLPRDAARVLVAQTLLGSSKLVLESDRHPAEIRDRVTTPGGCTIDALTALEDGKVRHALISAVVTAAAKSSALANGKTS